MTRQTLSPIERRSLEANLPKAYLFTFLMSFQLWWPIWVLYLQEKRGLSLTQITALESVFWLIILVAQVPAGAIADRQGRKVVLVMASLFLSAGILVFGLADSYLLILISYAGWALGLAFQYAGDSAFLFDSLKLLGRSGDFQKVYGRYWGFASLGVIGGLLLGAPLAAATNLSLPILLSSGISLLAAGVALSLREPVPGTLEVFADSSSGPAAGPLPIETRLSFGDLVKESFRLAYRRPQVRYVLLYGAFLGAAAFAPVIFIQPFLVRHDVGVSDLGLFQVPMRVLAVAGALSAYRISAVLGERRTMVLMPVLMFSGYVLLGAWDATYAYAAFPVVSLLSMMANPIVADYLNRAIPSEQRATMLSMRQLLFSFLVVPIAPLLGFVADEVSLMGAFLASALLVAVPMPVIFALWWRAEAKDPLGSQRIASG